MLYRYIPIISSSYHHLAVFFFSILDPREILETGAPFDFLKFSKSQKDADFSTTLTMILLG